MNGVEIFYNFVARIADNQAERLGGEFTATSGWREDLIDQLIVFSFEWIDERDALQRETILQIFGKQMPDAYTPCRSP